MNEVGLRFAWQAASYVVPMAFGFWVSKYFYDKSERRQMEVYELERRRIKGEYADTLAKQLVKKLLAGEEAKLDRDRIRISLQGRVWRTGSTFIPVSEDDIDSVVQQAVSTIDEQEFIDARVKDLAFSVLALCLRPAPALQDRVESAARAVEPAALPATATAAASSSTSDTPRSIMTFTVVACVAILLRAILVDGFRLPLDSLSFVAGVIAVFYTLNNPSEHLSQDARVPVHAYFRWRTYLNFFLMFVWFVVQMDEIGPVTAVTSTVSLIALSLLPFEYLGVVLYGKRTQRTAAPKQGTLKDSRAS